MVADARALVSAACDPDAPETAQLLALAMLAGMEAMPDRARDALAEDLRRQRRRLLHPREPAVS